MSIVWFVTPSPSFHMICSGWLEKKSDVGSPNHVLVSVADCWLHGVPTTGHAMTPKQLATE